LILSHSHELNTTVGVIHFNNKRHCQLHVQTFFQNKNYMQEPSLYLTKNTYFSHSSCIKYEYLSHAYHLRKNIIYIRNTNFL